MNKNAMMYWVETLQSAIRLMYKEKQDIHQNKELIQYYAKTGKIYLKYIEKEFEEILKT